MHTLLFLDLSTLDIIYWLPAMVHGDLPCPHSVHVRVGLVGTGLQPWPQWTRPSVVTPTLGQLACHLLYTHCSTGDVPTLPQKSPRASTFVLLGVKKSSLDTRRLNLGCKDPTGERDWGPATQTPGEARRRTFHCWAPGNTQKASHLWWEIMTMAV